MVQVVQPCTAGWSPAEIIAAVGVCVTSVLTAFLAIRRVRKDTLDSRRWMLNTIHQSRVQQTLDEECSGQRDGGPTR